MNAAEIIANAIGKLGYLAFEDELSQNATALPSGELDLALRRTISAQLKILRRGLALATAFPNSEWANTVDLARAILGDEE